MEYSDCDVLVIGYGESGKAVCEKVKSLGKNAYIYDKKSGFLKENDVERLIYGGKVGLAVISPGVPTDSEISLLLRKSGIKIVSELEYGASFFDGTVVAVTGTNGKTTTVTLIDKMLKEANERSFLCGNIGFPASREKIEKNATYVLECSSFQLETIKSFKPKIAAILNLSPDHLDRHKSLENYYAAKKRIYENQDENDFLVLPKNLDDKCDSKSKKYFFSLSEKTNGAHLEKDNIVFGRSDYVTGLRNIKLLGQHNIENILAAVTVAKLLKINNKYIECAISTFYGVPHRISYVKTIDGVKYYNDSKGTNVSSTLVAINAMTGETVLILGGKEKGIDYLPLFENLPKNVTRVIVFGENAERVLIDAEEANYRSISRCESLKECVLLARYYAKSGNVLLSPATSSFDMFSSYEERGECFEEIVRSL